MKRTNFGYISILNDLRDNKTYNKERIMFSGKKIIKYTCRKKVALGLALSFALVLLAVPAAEETGGVSQLSHQEMEGLLGGLSTCCDNCDDVYAYFSECYHSQSYPSSPNCEEDVSACISNTIVTASCAPGVPNADGCDTNWYYPATYSWHQDRYSITPECSWYNSDWSVVRKIYYGCDMGSLKVCADYTYIKACDKAGDICSGEWLSDDDKGLYRLECATCS